MIHVLKFILSLIIIIAPAINANAQIKTQSKGCAILFDNSNSMIQYFDPDQMEDAKQLIIDLLFEGKHDSTKWDFSGNSSELRKIWNPNMLLYLHPFGELSSPVDPFYRNLPEYEIIPDETEAKNFIHKYLFSKLNFRDMFTHIELARMLSWWKIAMIMGDEGKHFYMDVIIVTDGIEDRDMGFPDAGLSIRRAYSTATVSEVYKFLFEHKRRSVRNPGLVLTVQLEQIGPYYFPQPSPASSDSTGKTDVDFVKLTSPSNGKQFTESDKWISFAWSSEGNFEGYVLEIYEQLNRRKILEKHILNDKKYSVSIPKQILRQLGEPKGRGIKFSAYVRGVYPETVKDLVPVQSNLVSFTITPAGSSFPWGLTFLVLGIGSLATLYILYSNGTLQKYVQRLTGKIKKGEDDFSDI